MDSQPNGPSPDEVSVEAINHAVHRLNDGAAPAEVVSELVQMGVSEAAAVDVVRQVRDAHGLPERDETETAHPLNTFIKAIGYLIVAVGIFLWIGNIVGFFPTFPLAGFLTVVLGAGLLSVRLRKRSAGVEDE